MSKRGHRQPVETHALHYVVVAGKLFQPHCSCLHHNYPELPRDSGLTPHPSING